MLRRLSPYALFVILVCLFLWRAVFTGQALLPGDYLAQMQPWSTVSEPIHPAPQWNPLQWDAIAQFYPWRLFYARSMSDGYLPLWNPYQFCGTPFLANGQSAVLYPPNLLFLIFDTITAFTIYAVLHLFLAAAFTYLLMGELGCRPLGRIVAAVSFTFCAFMVLWLELPTFIGAAVWLPLVLLLILRAVERRSVFYGMLSGLALAMSFLAGHFQITFYVALAAGLWWLWQLVRVREEEGRTYAILRVVVPFIAFAVIVVLITSAQVIPTMELAQNSHRVREVSTEGYARFVSNAVQPYRLITAFVPDFFGNPSKNTYFLGSAADYMEYGLYIGILPLMLAFLAVTRIRKQRHVGFFALLALLAILTATGTPINALFYYVLPGFSALGGPNRILLLYFLGIAGLAGFGADYFADYAVQRTSWRRYSVSRALVAVIGIMLLMGVVIGAFHVMAVDKVEGLTMRHYDGIAGPTGLSFIVLFFVSAMLLVTYAGLAVSRVMLSSLAVGVIVADLFAFGINYNPTCDRAKVYPKTELTTYLQKTAGTSRIAPINPEWSLYETPRAILPPNAAMVYGLYDVQGYDSLYTKAYKDLSSEAQGVDSSPPENGNMVLVRRNVLFLFARYMLVHSPSRNVFRAERTERSCVHRVLDADGVSVYRWDRGFGSGFATVWIASTDHNVPAAWPGPNRVSVNSSWPSDKVTLGMPGYPGWIAYYKSGGRLEMEDDLHYVSVRTQNLRGHDVVEFSFQPFSFRFGLFLGMVGVSALLCVGIYRVQRGRHPTTH